MASEAQEAAGLILAGNARKLYRQGDARTDNGLSAITDEVLLEGMVFYGYHGVNSGRGGVRPAIVVDVAGTADLRERVKPTTSKHRQLRPVFKVVRQSSRITGSI